MKKDAQREQKKSYNTSHADIIDHWYSEVAFLGKLWKNTQLTQLCKLSWTSYTEITYKGHVEGSPAKVTCNGHINYLEWFAFINK